MKRATIVTGVTVVGVAWLLNYKVAAHQLTALPPASSTQGPGNPASPSPSPQATPPSATPTPSPSPSPSPSPTALSGTFTGTDVPNRFGDVQVRVVISNGRITDVQAVRLPTDRAESAYISQQVGPWLRTEVLQAQSANIDIISGATYTSQSYAQSLESALQQAHLG
ncbi:MAG TPA: FMN-binding protein [Candidatus Acidoferrum sp.]|nr:FMN-binding protein [Candidatus Acidoferrum sp.]